MRGLVLVSLAVLAACSYDNPWFGLQVGDGATTTSDAAPTSSSGAASTGDDATTGLPATASTSAGETGSSDTSTTSGDATTGAPMMCELPAKNDAFDPFVVRDGVAYADCDMPMGFFRGVLRRVGGALELVTTAACKVNAEGAHYLLGQGYPLPDDGKDYGCVEATVTWDDVPDGCKLGLLEIHPDGSNEPLFLGAFTLDPPDSFPLHTNSVNVTLCGCPGDPGCCPKPDAGEVMLTPDGGEPVSQFMKGFAKVDGQKYDFYNLQSWIGPECEDGGGRHIDWLAEAVDG